MAGEKYIVAAAENPMQIAVRNILNPCGYIYLSNCSDSISLLRSIRSYHPDFIVADANMQIRELKQTLETIDDEMLCACIVLGDQREFNFMDPVEKFKVISFCPKPINRDIFINTIEMTNLNYKRVFELSKKLKEMTENYETRKVVERAKWILMERDGVSENEAYGKMRKKSMDNRLTMKAIADAIIFTYEITNKK